MPGELSCSCWWECWRVCCPRAAPREWIRRPPCAPKGSADIQVAQVAEPANTLLIAEGGHRILFDLAYLRPTHEGGYLYDRPQRNHRQGSNAGFVDGHVRWYADTRWT